SDMGGGYPNGSEFNFVQQTTSGTTKAALDPWPTPIIFSGFEIGSQIQAGASETMPDNHPVRVAYEAHGAGLKTPSWDLTSAYIGVRGATDFWDVVSTGVNQIGADGGNNWQTSPDSEQSYITPRATNQTIADALSALVAKPAGTKE
ncbi:MAG TPA: hypothetical protein VGP93_09845, partial [Polyangiaceae bacterium]|nr:hypothetical protein [Polyangiaceae bacterium]